MFSDIPSHFFLPLSARKSILHSNCLYMGLFLCVGYLFFVTPKTVFVQIQACKLMIRELLVVLGFPLCPISYRPMPVLYTDLCVSISQGFCCNTSFMFLPGFESPRTPLDVLHSMGCFWRVVGTTAGLDPSPLIQSPKAISAGLVPSGTQVLAP